MNTIEDIKKIVVVEGLSDREKVKELKRLLGLQ
jgi:5S rRNA maturation endonuclease (ribonuclease M5)